LYKGQINKKLLTLLLIVINSLILFEHYSDFAISRLLRVTFGFSTEHMGQAANKATVLYTLLLPLLYHYICEKSWLYISLIIITIVNYLFHPMLAASLALVAAALVMLFIYRYGKNIFTLIFQGTIIFLISSPLLFKLCFSDSLLKLYFDHLPLSWQYRIHIWKNCLNFIWQKPFQGWGLNASRGLNEIAVYEKMGFIQNHPHNIGLQLWLENGLTGVVIICGLIYSFYHQLLVSASARSELAMWGGSFVATMVFANISLGIWQSWWVSSIWIVVLLYKMARAESNRS
jgi:O-antigen ligase